MKAIMGDHVEALVRGAAGDYLRLAKKKVTNRKAIVAVFTYALRAALDELSPDERAAWLDLALTEIQCSGNIAVPPAAAKAGA